MNKDFGKYDKVPSNFCLLPFLHKAIDSNGDYKPCCVADPHKTKDGQVANINFIHLDEFVKSKEIADFKQQFKDNQRSELCANCWTVDDQGGESHRKRIMTFFMNKSWESGESQLYKKLEAFFNDNKEWTEVAVELDKVESPWDLEIEPGTTCNFKCHFCGPYASSSWQSDQKELYGTSTEEVSKFTKMGHWALDSELWNSEVMFAGKKFHFMGGEPMLIDAHFKFLKRLSERIDAKQVIISYNTNASKLPPQYALDQVYNKFKTNRVAFSIDAIGDRFHYQRYPGDWTVAENNMKTWISAIPDSIQAKIDPGWSILNLLYMGELFLWADTFKVNNNLTDNQFDFDGHYYFGPYYCPQTLTVEQKELFKKKMTADIEMLRSCIQDKRMMDRAEITYKNMLDHMLAADKWTQEIEDRRNHRIRGLDKIRNQSIKDYEPELNEILKIYD
jgi:sulfatase maturation enzyme AslB (radical SAM superfamily)